MALKQNKKIPWAWKEGEADGIFPNYHVTSDKILYNLSRGKTTHNYLPLGWWSPFFYLFRSHISLTLPASFRGKGHGTRPDFEYQHSNLYAISGKHEAVSVTVSCYNFSGIWIVLGYAGNSGTLWFLGMPQNSTKTVMPGTCCDSGLGLWGITHVDIIKRKKEVQFIGHSST